MFMNIAENKEKLILFMIILLEENEYPVFYVQSLRLKSLKIKYDLLNLNI